MTFKSILDPDFKYRNSSATDVRKTFERIRRRQRRSELAAQPRQQPQDRGKVVATIGKGVRRSA